MMTPRTRVGLWEAAWWPLGPELVQAGPQLLQRPRWRSSEQGSGPIETGLTVPQSATAKTQAARQLVHTRPRTVASLE